MTIPEPQHQTHDCGGTIVATSNHQYCDRCWAYTYDEAGESMPTGTDEAANRTAWDAGARRSPEAQTVYIIRWGHSGIPGYHWDTAREASAYASELWGTIKAPDAETAARRMADEAGLVLVSYHEAEPVTHVVHVVLRGAELRPTVGLCTLTRLMRDDQRTAAPGSETLLWGEYCRRVYDLTGVYPCADYEGDHQVPLEVAAWFLGASLADVHEALDGSELAGILPTEPSTDDLAGLSDALSDLAPYLGNYPWRAWVREGYERQAGGWEDAGG